MNFHPDPTTVSSAFRPSTAFGTGEAAQHQQHTPQKPRIVRRPRAAAYIAFFITVFASMAAAAALVTQDMPLMVVGL